MSGNTEPKVPTWWGLFTLPEQQTGFWSVGPLQLWIQHLQQEWRIAYHNGGDPLVDQQVDVQVPGGEFTPSEEAILERYSFRRTSQLLRLSLALADRPVISRPETPLFIPPGEEVTLYVSSPLWCCIEVGESYKLLREFPVFRPSDTWFGPPTRSGGLAYATKTLALTSLKDYPFTAFRAITPLLIRNRTHSQLLIERLNIPVLYLSLYQAEDGTLWTQSVTLERDEDDDEELALLKLGSGPPQEAGTSNLLATPRKKAEKNLVIRAFSRLFG